MFATHRVRSLLFLKLNGFSLGQGFNEVVAASHLSPYVKDTRLVSSTTGGKGNKHKHKPLPPRRKIDEAEIEENFVKGTGPGGQKINKTSSAVQLIHHPTNTVVKCQETRSRSQNRKLARQLLAEKLDFAEKGDESRLAIKADRARKKKASADKKKRRKYRALEASKSTNNPSIERDAFIDREDDYNEKNSIMVHPGNPTAGT